MVTGWRRAFCTSIPKQQEEPKLATDKPNHNTHTSASGSTGTKSPRFGSKFNFFSSSSSSQPSTPRVQTTATTLSSEHTHTPTLRCRTSTPTKLQCKTTTPSPSPSPRSSPSAFALLLKNSLRLSKPVRCGICSQNVKTGQGTAIFTAECSHSFHFPCLAVKSTSSGIRTCPVCGSHWKESPFVNAVKKSSPNSDLRLYDDDEPLMSPVSGIRFIAIPEESDTEESADEFPGFFSDPVTPRRHYLDEMANRRGVDVSISPEAAVVAVGRSYETYAVMLTVKAPPSPVGSRRPSVDLVAVIDVGSSMTASKLHALKRAMLAVLCSLSSNDRLSIVAFSSNSKRLLPLRRMTPSGRRSARRIIDALNSGQGSCVNDALRKAAKVLQDRKEKNHFAAMLLLNAGNDNVIDNHNSHVKSTRFSHMEIPVHTFSIGEHLHDDAFVKTVDKLLTVVVLDLRIQFGLASGSAPAEIAAVYNCTGRPGLMSRTSSKLGDMYSEEEREILIELKVPASAIGSGHLISVLSTHKEPSSKATINGRDQSVIVPRPHTIRSSNSNPSVQRLRSLFVMTRAVAESRRLLSERNDLVGAERLLVSARAVLGQGGEEYRKRVEAELAEVRWRRQEERRRREKEGGGGGCCLVDEKGEPLTPTSAWKAAERLAKVAVMRKSLNRVSDLHGFEDARF